MCPIVERPESLNPAAEARGAERRRRPARPTGCSDRCATPAHSSLYNMRYSRPVLMLTFFLLSLTV